MSRRHNTTPQNLTVPPKLTGSRAPRAQPGTSTKPGGPSESSGPARRPIYTVQPTEDDKDVTARIEDSRGKITIWDLVTITKGQKGLTATIESKVTVTLEHALIIDKNGQNCGPTVKGWAILKAPTGTAWLQQA